MKLEQMCNCNICNTCCENTSLRNLVTRFAARYFKYGHV